MADVNNNQNGVFGGVQFNGNNNGVENTSYFDGMANVYGSNTTVGNGNVYGNYGINGNLENNSRISSNAGSYNGTLGNNVNFEPIPQAKAITKQGLWTKIRAFLFQEIDINAPIKVELTPYQQKVENEINEFLHQEVSFKGIANLFKSKK